LARAAQRLERNAGLAQRPVVEATLRFDIGSTYQKLGLFEEAAHHLQRALLLREQNLGPDNRDTLATQLQLAALMLNGLRRFEVGERLSQDALERLQRLVSNHRDEPDLKLYRESLDAMSYYAQSLMHEGNFEKALQLTRQNAQAYERVFGPDDLDSINELQNVALVLGAVGNYAEAETNVREALKRYDRTDKSDDENALNGINSLALYRQYQGDAPEAEHLLMEAYPRAVRLLGQSHPLTLHLQFRLARVLAEEGRLVEAEDLARKTLAVRQQVLQRDSAGAATAMLLLGRILVERAQSNQLEEAESLLRQARVIFIERLTPKPELPAATENWLGAIQLVRRDFPAAERLMLPNAERLFVPTGELSPNERRLAVGHLVALYRAWEKPEAVDAWQKRLDGLAGAQLSHAAR
jgi:tetratricopeptide (TPR) repeat protein